MDYDDDLPPGYAPEKETSTAPETSSPANTIPEILKSVGSTIVNDTLAGIRKILDVPRNPEMQVDDHPTQSTTAAARATTVADWVLSTTTSTQAPSSVPTTTSTPIWDSTTSRVVVDSTTSEPMTTSQPNWGSLNEVEDLEWVGGGTNSHTPIPGRPEHFENPISEVFSTTAVEALAAVTCFLVLAYMLHSIFIYLYRLAYRHSAFHEFTGRILRLWVGDVVFIEGHRVRSIDVFFFLGYRTRVILFWIRVEVILRTIWPPLYFTGPSIRNNEDRSLLNNTIGLQQQYQAHRLKILPDGSGATTGMATAQDRYWHRAQSLASSEDSDEGQATVPVPDSSILRGADLTERSSRVISPSSVIPSPQPMTPGTPIPFLDDAAFQLWLASRAGPNYPVLPHEGSVRRKDPIGRKKIDEEKEKRRLGRAKLRKERERMALGVGLGVATALTADLTPIETSVESDATSMSERLRRDLKISPAKKTKAETEDKGAKDMERREERASMEAKAEQVLSALPRVHFTRGMTRFRHSPVIIQDSGPVSILTEGESKLTGHLEETEPSTVTETSSSTGAVLASQSPQSPVIIESRKASEVCTPLSASSLKPQETSTPRDDSFFSASSSLASASAESKLIIKS